MADTITPNYGFILPEPGGSDETWGDKLNANWTDVDGLLGGSAILPNLKLNDTLSIVDDVDNSKVVKFQVSGVSPATTRTYTFPDASGTLVLTATEQTLTGKTLVSAILTDPEIVTPTMDLSTVTSGGDLSVANGGTGASTAAAARSNLGLTETVVTTTLASQAEAEAGTNNTKLVTPLRVAQAIAEKVPVGITIFRGAGIQAAFNGNHSWVTGFGRAPDWVTLWAQAKAGGANGYAGGDRLLMTDVGNTTGANLEPSLYYEAAGDRMRYLISGVQWAYLAKPDGSPTYLVPSDFTLYLTAGIFT